MPQQAVWGKGFLESCLELVTDFKRQAKTLFLLYTKQQKNVAIIRDF
jgi:hypothetical protein